MARQLQGGIIPENRIALGDYGGTQHGATKGTRNGAAKRFVTAEKPIIMDDMVELLIQQLTNNANTANVVQAASVLHEKGVSVRTLAKALGMKHNTLSYQLKKIADKEDVE
jgi:predicted transcriptional regulator